MANVDVGLPVPLGNYSYLPPVQTGVNDAVEEKAMNQVLAWLAGQGIDLVAEKTGFKDVLRERGAGILDMIIPQAQAAETAPMPPVQTGFQPTTSVVAQDVVGTPIPETIPNPSYVPDSAIPMEGRDKPAIGGQFIVRQDWQGPGRGVAPGDTLPDGSLPVNMDGEMQSQIQARVMRDAQKLVGMGLDTPQKVAEAGAKEVFEADQRAAKTPPGSPPPPPPEGGVLSTLGDYFKSEEAMAYLVMGLNSLRSRPDQGIAQVLGKRIETLRGNRQANRTADYLESIGQKQAADLVRMGFPAKDAIGAGKQFDIGSGADFAEKFGITGLEPNKPYKRNMQTGEVSQIGGAGTNVDINMKAETKYAEEVRKRFAEDESNMYKAAMAAPMQLEKLYETRSLIEQGDPQTGAFAELSKNIQRVRAKLFDSETAQVKVADTELLNSLLGSDVFGMIGALGIGARGLDTPAEREFLREVMTGTISLNKDTLLRMLDIRENVQRRAIENYNQAVSTGDLDDFFEASRKKKRIINIPQYSPRPMLSPQQEQSIQAGGAQRIGNTTIRQVSQ